MTELHFERTGSGPPLVLLHGFTGSTRSWDLLVPGLAGVAECISIDLVGHGQSPAPDRLACYSMDACVADVVGVLDGLRLERADVLGYSMGGRVALHLAIAAPRRVRRLVLESASPGLDDSLERAERVRADSALADQIEAEGIAAFVERWEHQPLLALGPAVLPELRERVHSERLRNRPRGLANSLRGMGVGAPASAWDKLAAVSCPTLLLVGARDAKYRAIAKRMLSRLASADLVVLPDAGHTAHLEQARAFAAAVTEFLKKN
jgi:2-succinyl-6-hydroxy-2,4-cyclohexadiene-1-carboxylate synthase